MHEVPDIDNRMVDKTKEDTLQNNLFGHKDTLFFNNNDVRFNGMYIKKSWNLRIIYVDIIKIHFTEAVKFFSTEAASNDKFNNLRCELKTIVRMKIRNNERRHQPYGKKRKIKRSQ